jgi:putative ABC transport system permease protein
MIALWDNLSALSQDIVLAFLLILPTLCIGTLVLRGYAAWPLVSAILWRFQGANITFMLLITLSIGLGLSLSALESGLRKGIAKSTDKFDLLVTAPGSETKMILATVYLESIDIPLLSGKIFTEVEAHEKVDMAAPLAFGDSYGISPIVGTTADFLTHLSDGKIKGRMWETSMEAVIGTLTPLEIGEKFVPSHGMSFSSQNGAHAGYAMQVVGRLPPTGTPWDQAILVPIEAVWEVHGLANGHAPDRFGQLGGPFDAEYFPGTPAIIIKAHELWSNYALRSEFTRSGTSMAFFPASVLSNVFQIMANIRKVMSVMSVLTQAITACSVLMSLIIISRLFQRQMSVLRALGAPTRFVFAVLWAYCMSLLTIGALIGAFCGAATAAIVSYFISLQTGILVSAPFGWDEMHYLLSIISAMALLSLIPAFAVFQKSIVEGLRS